MIQICFIKSHIYSSKLNIFFNLSFYKDYKVSEELSTSKNDYYLSTYLNVATNGNAIKKKIIL